MATNYGKTLGNENYGGMCRIYVDLYRDLLWAIFINQVPISKLVSELEKILKNARTFKPFHHQFNRLLNDVYASTGTIKNTDCDISVIYSLFRNIRTTLHPPTHGWGNVPQPGGVLVTDDLERIHHGRNTLIGHTGEASITDAGFTAQLSDINDIVTRLDGHLGSSYLPHLLRIESDCQTSKGHLNHYDEYIKELKRQQEVESDLRDLVSEKLGAHDAKFDEQDTKFEEQDTKFTAHDTKFDEQDTKFDEQDTKSTAHDTKFEEQDTKFTVHDTKFDKQDTKCDEQDTKLTAHDTKFEEQDTKLTVHDTKFDEQDTKFDEQDNKFEEQDTKFTAHDTKFDEQDTKFDEQDTKSTAHDTKFEEQDTKFTVHDTKFDKQDTKCDEQDTKLTAHDTKFEEQDTKLTVHDTKCDEQDTKLTAHDTKFEEQDTKLTVHDTKFDEQDTKFDEQDNKFEEQDTKFTAHDTKFDEQDTKFDEQDTKSTAHDTKFEEQDTKFTVHDTKFDKQDTKCDEQDTKLTAHDTKFEEQDTKLTVHDTKCDEQDTKLTAHDTKFEEQDTKLTVHDTKFDEQDTKFDEQDNKFEEQDTKFTAHDTKFDEQDTKFDEQDTKSTAHDTKFEEQDTKFTVHDTKFDKQDTKFEEQDTKLTVHDTKFDEQDTKFDEQDNKFEEQDNKFGALASKLEEHGTKYGDLETKIEEQEQIYARVQYTIEEHRQERDEDRRRLTAVQRRQEEERQTKHERANELSAEIDELKHYLVNKKYKGGILQGKPSQWFKMKDVLQMFVPLEIREDLERWMALSSTERKKERLNQASDGKEITSMHDIFFKGSERQYHIYLLGEAGVGKSTFCHQLVDNWCRVQDSEPKTDYESELKLFEFLFFIQARNSDKSQTVYKMIKEQLCPLKYHKILEELFTSQPESCLVLIDGLDEWQSGIRGYQELPNVTEIEGSTILITSRQWRVEALDCDLGPSCRVLEIRGLDSGGIHNLAVRVFEVFTREDNPGADCKQLVKQFMDKLNLLKLKSFARIPFLLIILIKSWLIGNRNIENARGFIYSGLIEALLVHSGKKVEYTGTMGDRTNTPALPSCFNKREHCQSYSSLIHELSRLAFKMLFSDEKENSLVFRKQDLDQQLGIKEHLTLCLKLGLLTETKDLSETKECQRSFSFPHKSIQEYFSALFLSGDGFKTGFARFCERVTSSAEVFDFENVLLFLNGMNQTHCKTLFDFICNIVFARQFADETLYPAGWSMRDKIIKVKKLALLCTAEARHSVPEGAHPGELQFVLPDMVVDEYTPAHKVAQFCSLGLNIKSLVYDGTVTHFSVVESIRTMQHIQRLGIGCKAENTEKYIAWLCRYLSNLHQLKSFSFSVEDSIVRLPLIHVSTKLVSKLGTLPNLVSVYLHRLDLSDINTCKFTSQLKSLGLSNTKSLSPGVMSGWCNQLHTLYMWKVDLFPAAVHQLRQYLMTSFSLQSLALFLPNIDIPHPFYTVFDDVLDLTSHTSLHTLELSCIDLKSGMRIHLGHNWRKINMTTVSMHESMWQEFINNLPTEPLQTLDVEFCGVISLNTQTLSYIRDKFCVTVDTVDTVNSRYDGIHHKIIHKSSDKINLNPLLNFSIQRQPRVPAPKV